MSFLREISPMVRSIHLPGQEVLMSRAARIRTELRQGIKKDFMELIDLSSSDIHSRGIKPISFLRQVMAACCYPSLLHSDRIPADARERARSLLTDSNGGSIGSYPPTGGMAKVRRSVSDFITRRDGGVPSIPEHIFLTTGSQQALTIFLKLLVSGEGPLRTGVLVPVPSYSTFSMALANQGGVMVPYYLCEEQGWALEMEELQRALQAARGHCNPMALYVINPGNPSGLVQSRKSIEEVIRFAAQERLFLLVDEVYQETIHGEDTEFVSYKRVLFEMGSPYSSTVELASFHSVSKGTFGEYGMRGGYVELVNLDPKVMEHALTFFNRDGSGTVMGQIALDILADPPQLGDPSYPLYSQEVQSIKNTLLSNVRRVHSVLNGVPGMSCQPIRGGLYAFVQLHLPQRVIEQAKEAGVEPDMMYCQRLLNEAGLCVVPGCECGQREGSYHIRFCIGVQEEIMEEVLQRLKSFHSHFMREFS
ncbi:alanine aminotransferase 2 [Chanos chanos]|uniref:alanine transaminase n=1 Tax=Chanos chanos TaxID=29144 RepID=A0A6J2VCX5_CHACN|nr:alanine aminotransferase 2-like [Chanos chanos]